MPHRTIAITALTAAAALALPAGANAGFFPGDPVDGPANIETIEGLDIARDGTGAVVYRKREGGISHVYVARLVNGVWDVPIPMGVGLPGEGTDAAVAASDGGRVAVAFVKGGTLYTRVLVEDAPAFTAPTPIASGARNPSVDMSIHGTAYVSFTAPGASPSDVRLARLDRKDSQFRLLPDILDLNPAQEAGDGTKRSRTVVAGDGTAVTIWGETAADGRTHVVARRSFGDRLSAFPQDLTMPSLAGRPGLDADLPEIDIEDDSSYAWATFRQRFLDGAVPRTRTITRRLVGSLFETPFAVDGLVFPAAEGSTDARVAISGRGEGFVVSARTGSRATMVTPIHDDKPFPPVAVDGGAGVDPKPDAAFPETGPGLIASIGGTPGASFVRARQWNLDRSKRTVGSPEPEVILSRPELGPVVVESGLEAASNRAGDVVVLSVQQAPDGRRLVSATFDRPPGDFRGTTTTKFRNATKPEFNWLESFELWGPLTYTVEVDGQPVGSTTDTEMKSAVKIEDGLHKWRVVATDRRGQTERTELRNLRVDAADPELSVKVSGERKPGARLRIRVRASDAAEDGKRASGMKRVRVRFGDGSRTRTISDDNSFTLSHRYRRGTHTLRVSATDEAGNATVVKRRLRVR